MNNKKAIQVDLEPYASNDNINVSYTLDYDGIQIAPPMKIKIKNMQGTFRFKCLAHNKVLDTQWIDCYDDSTGALRAFHLDKLKGVVTTKRTRRKKKNE